MPIKDVSYGDPRVICSWTVRSGPGILWRMSQYLVGADGTVERPSPLGPGNAAQEIRQVPEGLVHAVDPESRLPLCGAAPTTVVLETPWEDLWKLSWVGGPEKCAACVSVSTPDHVKRQLLDALEGFEASTSGSKLSCGTR